MVRLLEIRTYKLKPGTADAFHETMHTKAVPFIRSHGMDVVAYGHSDNEEPTYFLARAYANRPALNREQAAFYGSSAWQQSESRAELLKHISDYANTLIFLSEASIEDMRLQNALPRQP